ncbi:MAG: glutathione S-transferase [Gammaproteobacteria bacterium]|jgi:glutathione S-transferase
MKPYRIIGIDSSPYAVKVRAVMRYRRLPHLWIARMPQFYDETAHVRPLIMPVVQFPNGEYRTDSTPIIHALEAAYPNARSVIPVAPELAFLSALIEDMADEWLAKSIFHYRFSAPVDQEAGARWVMDDAHPGLDQRELAGEIETFVTRQVERMPMVGCTPANGPLFEQFFRSLLACLEPFVAAERFLFGSRPALADFGLYGQLQTLAGDPTPGALMRASAPRVRHWVGRLDDASGVDGHWCESLDELGSARAHAVEGLLELAGRFYLPFLAANAQAFEEGASMLDIEIGGQRYAQPPFRYQAKCFSVLRRDLAHLTEPARASITPLLTRTDCLHFLAD